MQGGHCILGVGGLAQAWDWGCLLDACGYMSYSVFRQGSAWGIGPWGRQSWE